MKETKATREKNLGKYISGYGVTCVTCMLAVVDRRGIAEGDEDA